MAAAVGNVVVPFGVLAAPGLTRQADLTGSWAAGMVAGHSAPYLEPCAVDHSCEALGIRFAVETADHHGHACQLLPHQALGAGQEA